MTDTFFEIWPIIWSIVTLGLMGFFVYVMVLLVKALKKYLREDTKN
jgi:hypothetical protein